MSQITPQGSKDKPFSHVENREISIRENPKVIQTQD
jgi:hypothetical protein